MAFDFLPHAFFTLTDGSRLRYARFEPAASPRGTILIVPGRREFIEKKFFELGQPLLDAGYRLIFIEPRGQGLSSRFLSGDSRQRDHSEDFAVHLNDLREFFARIVMRDMTAPLIVHGHSLGAHLTLRWLSEDRPPVAAAFLTAPLLALSAMPAHVVAHGISWTYVHVLQRAAEYAATQENYGPKDDTYEGNVLTQDPERFPIIKNYFTAHPDLTVGGVTWGWMLAALQSMHITHARHYLARIDIPVLALVGSEDKVTPAKEITPYLNFIPRVQTHVIAGARHDVLNEINSVRSEAWQKIGAFLSSVTPPAK